MKVLEVILSKNSNDRSLSGKRQERIDFLKNRIQMYADKINDPATSPHAGDFLKSKLALDKGELEYHMKKLEEETTDQLPVVQYEVYDRKTGATVRGRGPYTDKTRARRARDQLDNAYGGYRYGVRPVGQKGEVMESINRVPLSNEDFDRVKELMTKPIPAAVAPIYIQEVIDDDELHDTFAALSENNPAQDVRPIIAEWFNRVMPDQMYRFRDDQPSYQQKAGLLSPIHGYDPKMYKGSNDPITGNAYGRR